MRGHMSNVVPGLTWVCMARCPPWLPVKSIADFLPYDHSIVEGYDPSLEVAVPLFVLLLLQEGHVKQTLGSYHFAGQHQQTPAPLEGGLVKRHWFR